MRLLFVIKSLGFAGGGAERVLIDVTGELAKRGHAVTIASFDAKGTDPFYPLPVGVSFRGLGAGNLNRPTQLTDFIVRLRALKRLNNALQPDVAIGFMHSSYVALSLALAGSGVPVIGSEHIVFEHYLTRPRQRFALLRTAPLLYAMTAVSEPMRATFPRALQRKMRVIANSLSAPDRPADPIGGPLKRLLSVGRLEPQKDYRTLVSAFALIADRFPAWTLRIVGEGSLRAPLESQVRSLELGNRIELPGPERNVGREYAKAQLFVLPSLYESFGLVTAEAMSHGLPAVGFADCPGTNELIDHGVNGLLARDRGSPEALANALAQLMASDEDRLRMGRAAPATVTQFAIGVVVDRWEELLREAARQKPRQTSNNRPWGKAGRSGH